MQTANRFIAFANSRNTRTPLPNVVEDANRLAELLRIKSGFETEVLADLDPNALSMAVKTHLAKAPLHPGALIMLWSGHGELGDDGTLRLLGSYQGEDVVLASPGQLGEWAMRTGATQVLVFIDACFSGAGLVDATRLAQAVSAGRNGQETRWFGCVAASLADQKARSGALTNVLYRLLDKGSGIPDDRLVRWSRKVPRIRGDDLVQALVSPANWNEPRQAPLPVSSGVARDLVRNPLYTAGPGEEPVEHLLRAAHGSAGDESFFTGREDALARIVAWLRRGTLGLCLLTGPAGCGKSAVAGRVVSLSIPAERKRLLAVHAVAAALDPGESCIGAQLQAHGATLDTATADLSRQFGAVEDQGLPGVLAEAEERKVQGKPLVVVVDGLDEALADQRDPLATELLQPLARRALVIVATREVRIGDTSLIALLGNAAETIPLGADAAALRDDVHLYVRRRIQGVSASMDPSLVADELSQARGDSGSASFLLARLVTSQLRDRPVDTAAADWRLALANTVESALERDLQSVVLDIDGTPQPTAARELLRALTHALGSGFPADDVWPAVASQLSWTGTTYRREHVYDVMGQLGRHIVATSDRGQALYRVAHQQLADYLAESARRDASRPAGLVDDAALAEAVADVYEQWLDDGLPPRAHGYLWQFAWVHLADGGAAGWQRLENLATRDRAAFAPDLAAGYELAGMRAMAAARAAEALSLGTKAVAVRRELNDPLSLANSLLYLANAHATVGDDEGSDQAADEALEIARSLGGDAQGRAAVANGLLARVNNQIRAARPRMAKRLADEIIAMETLSGAAALDDTSRNRLCMVYVLASQAALALNDFAEAERCARLALEIAEQPGVADQEPLIFLEACSGFAVIQFMRSQAGAKDADGRWPSIDTSAGSRVLALVRKSGSRGDLCDVLAAKGLIFLVKSWLLGKGRGAAEVPNDQHLNAVIDDALELLRPHAPQLVQAAILLSECLTTRAALLLMQSDPTAAVRCLTESASSLRTFPASNPGIRMQLGQTLDMITQAEWPQFVAGALAQPEATLGRQQEAVALLRIGELPLVRMALGVALTRLAALLAPLSTERSAAARVEAIEVLRGAVAFYPQAAFTLSANLVDQSGYLSANRAAEALDMAREAVGLVADHPPEQVATLAGLAELNQAGASLALGQFAGTRELLESARTRLEPSAKQPLAASWLAAVEVNLAKLELFAERFDLALAHARNAMAWLATPGIPAFAMGGELLALAVLGAAERATGDIAQGSLTLRLVIDGLRSAAAQHRPDVAALMLSIDQAAPELWDEAIAALGDRPALVHAVRLMRRRPRAELAHTVRLLIDAVEAAEPAGLREVRQIARSQRSLAAEEFDQAWLQASGNLPDWLRIDNNLEWALIAWWNVRNWSLSRDLLAARPLLLDAQTDVLLEEMAFGAPDRQFTDLHLGLLAAARSDGVEAAYAPLLLDVEVSGWLDSVDLKEHFTEHPELLRPQPLEQLRARAANGDSRAHLGASILELALRGEAELAFAAADRPESMAESLRAAWRSSDATRLESLAVIVFHAAAVDGAVMPIQRQAAVALAVAWTLLNQRPEEVAPWLVDALAGTFDAERAALAGIVTDAIGHHLPMAATLVQLLPCVTAESSVTRTPDTHSEESIE